MEKEEMKKIALRKIRWALERWFSSFESKEFRPAFAHYHDSLDMATDYLEAYLALEIITREEAQAVYEEVKAKYEGK